MILIGLNNDAGLKGSFASSVVYKAMNQFDELYEIEDQVKGLPLMKKMSEAMRYALSSWEALSFHALPILVPTPSSLGAPERKTP